MTQRRPRLSLLLGLLAALLTAFTLAACGGGDSGGGNAAANPATLAPADAPVFIDATIRPEGQQLNDLRAAAGKLLKVPNPDQKLVQLFDDAVHKSPNGKNVSYEKNIKPWLGKKAGVFVMNLQKDSPDVAFIIASSDTGKASDEIAAAFKDDKQQYKTLKYKDVEYRVDSDNFAGTVVGDFVVFGDEVALKRTIDVSKGEAPLADSAKYKSATANLSGDRVGSAYVDTKSLIDLAMKQDPSAAASVQQFQGLFQLDKLQPVVAGLLADGNKVAIETTGSTAGTGVAGPLGKVLGAGPSELIGQLPSDALAAFGIPKFGQTLEAVYDQFAAQLPPGFQDQLKSQIGLDPKTDIFSWMGDVALFERGSTPDTLNGALVIQTTDAAKAKAAIGKLVDLATATGGAGTPKKTTVAGADNALSIPTNELPAPIILAQGNDRVVLAIGERAAADGIKAGSTLSSSPLYKDAQAKLGDIPPSLLISAPQIVSLLSSQLSGDADFAMVKPYLDAVSVIASGGKVEGDKTKSQIALGLK